MNFKVRIDIYTYTLQTENNYIKHNFENYFINSFSNTFI